ncbi:MAG TPA: hypothetical protein VLM91_19325 [Candidatus Methylomirabilis sp.]|nr:hypothetical protein [Candidatus Methylomirabilis sp.]
MTRPSASNLRWALVILALALAACSQQQGQSTAASVEPVKKTFTLMPGNTTVKIDFLTGQLENLTVTEQVDPKTSKLVDRPELRGTLKLKNGSTDQSARLIGGKLLFLDAKGQPIPVAKDRGDTSFTFSSYETQRLDPGQETSVTIDVPFPQAGLKASDLQSVRVDLTYLPTPYREQAVNVPVAVKG